MHSNLLCIYYITAGTSINNYYMEDKIIKLIEKMNLFCVGNKKVFSYENINVLNPEKGYFILDMWNQCSEPDINILPVKYVECENKSDLYLLRQDNIIIGRGDEIC